MAVTYRQSKAEDAVTFKKRVLSAGILLGCTVFPGMFKKIIKQQFFRPSRYPYTPDRRACLDAARPMDLNVHGDIVKCWCFGDGPAVIFVHGWNGAGLQFRSFLDRTLSLGFSAVLFDGPGHGLSGGTTCSYFQMTDVVRALLNQPWQQGVAGLVGHSFGAAAIVNSLSKESISVPAVLIAPALDLMTLLGTAFRHHAVPESVYMGIIGDFEKRYGYVLRRDNPANLLPDIRTPLLIVHDSGDRVIPHGFSKGLASTSKGIHFLSTDGLGHKQILKDNHVAHEAVGYIARMGAGEPYP